MPVAQKAGELAVQLHEGQMARIEIDYAGEIAQHDVTPLKAAVIGGLLAPISVEHVNVVNVDIIASAARDAAQAGAQPEPRDLREPSSRVRLESKEGTTEVAGTIAHDGPHIVSIDGYWVDIPPSEGYLLLCENRDRPGMIGAVGTLMGEFGVNISFMNVGPPREERRRAHGDRAGRHADAEQIARVREIEGIRRRAAGAACRERSSALVGACRRAGSGSRGAASERILADLRCRARVRAVSLPAG